MRRLLFISCFALLCMASSCEKKNPNPIDQLPAETQTGANTFGCLMNGDAWLPVGFPGPGGSLSVHYYNGALSMAATKKDGDFYNSITWAHENVFRPGKYYFKYISAGPPGAKYDNDRRHCYYFAEDADSLDCYVIITKLDQHNMIMSGTFNLKLFSDSCGYVNITNGRFDSKFSN